MSEEWGPCQSGAKERLKNLKVRISSWLKDPGNKDFLRKIIVFTAVAVCVAVFVRVPIIPKILALVIFSLLAIAMMILAAHSVMKPLFVVSAELSLIIFIALSYCEISIEKRFSGGDEGLKLLVVLGISFVAFQFVRFVYVELKKQIDNLREAGRGKSSWLMIVMYAFFVGLFVNALIQVVGSILMNLCVYQG